jgi:raffinose/stachyose/melibiose transport system permease protein
MGEISMKRDIQKKSNVKKKKNYNLSILYIVLTLFAVLNIYPLIWMVYTSFKTNKEISQSTFALPKSFHFENYINAWKTANVGTYFINSMFVSVVSIAITVLIGAMAAYILGRFKFKLNKTIHTIFVFGMLIPINSILVPLFIQMRGLHLLNTRWALIFPYVAFGLPITIYILTSFMKAFPTEVEEAAILDGCTVPQLFLRIILPMAKPAITTVVIMNFLTNWNEFSLALVLINDNKIKTLPIGLVNFAGAYTRDYAQMTAGLVISVIPIILIYIFLQENIIKGMTQGGVKG